MLAALLLLAGPVSGVAREKRPAPVAVPDLPVPPIPPGPPPDDGAAAPLPNFGFVAPDRPLVSRGVTLTPGVFTNRTRDLTDGFLGNSDAQTENERRQRPIPGLKLSVPIR